MHRKVIMCDAVRWPFLIRIPFLPFSGFLLCGFSFPLLDSTSCSLPFQSLSLPLWCRWEAASEKENRDQSYNSFPPVVSTTLSLRAGREGAFPGLLLITGGEEAILEEAVWEPGTTRLLPNSNSFSSQRKGWVGSTCRCGCETGSKICFQSLFVNIKRSHRLADQNQKRCENCCLAPFVFIIISRGAATLPWNWNSSF